MHPINAFDAQASRADLRWSEVVPAPATALTFAALWDPEEGMVTFGGAELTGPRCNNNDSRSQILPVDGFDTHGLPSPAMGSSLFPYAQSRFAASELSTNRLPLPPTRRSSAGTGLPLDLSNHVDLPHQGEASHPLADGMPQPLHFDSDERATPLNRIRHRHINSGDSGSSHTLTVLGYGLCKAFRRDTLSKQSLSKEDRYGYLQRTALKAGSEDHGTVTVEPYNDYPKKQVDLDAPKSAGLRSMFARSIWARSAMHFACESRVVCSSEDYDSDSIALDSGFDHFDADSGVGVSWETDGPLDIEKELDRNTKALKSTFSWTTTSTSRYIDVAEFLEEDSDSDSTLSPVHTTIQPDTVQSSQAEGTHVHAPVARDNDSEWLSIEPPTPRPDFVFPAQGKVHRKLVKKHSSSTVGGSTGAPKASKLSDTSSAGHKRYRVHLHIEEEIEVSEENDMVRVDNKGKGRSNSQPEISGPLPLGHSVTVGRPAVQRSASSPAAAGVSPRLRTPSIATSSAPSPAEVLARSSYNHEWTTAEASSHLRSSSDPIGRTKATTVGHGSSSYTTGRHSPLNDVRDVLRGLQTGVRPSTPLPGLPNGPPSRSRPPPTSFRPVSASAKYATLSPSTSTRCPSPSCSVSRSPDPMQFPSANLSRSCSQDGHDELSSQAHPGGRKRAHSLENLTESARSLALATTSPIRNLLRQSQIRKAQQAQRCSGDEDGVWICVDVDVNAPPSRAVET